MTFGVTVLVWAAGTTIAFIGGTFVNKDYTPEPVCKQQACWCEQNTTHELWEKYCS